MLVRAKETCFRGGVRRRPGAVFEHEVGEGESLPASLEPVVSAGSSEEAPYAPALPLIEDDTVEVPGSIRRGRRPKSMRDYDVL